MPNHIQNRLTVTGNKDEVTKLFASISSEDKEGVKEQIDFNKIVPMPEGMDVSVHSGVETWVEICTGQVDFNLLFTSLPDSISNLMQQQQYGTLSSRLSANTAMETLMGKRKGNVKDFTDEEFDGFVQCLKNFRSTGFHSWYNWAIKNWGTKWNAYGQNDKRNTENAIYFETGWSSPIGLIQKLSAKFPELTLQLDYADEDSGSNTGMIQFVNGEATNVIQPESQSKEGYDIYFDLHPDSKADYKLVGDKYEYIEEEVED